MHAERDPEAVANHRSAAETGEFEVVVEHPTHGELGTLNETFYNMYDADIAARQAAIEDVCISTSVRSIDDSP